MLSNGVCIPPTRQEIATANLLPHLNDGGYCSHPSYIQNEISIKGQVPHQSGHISAIQKVLPQPFAVSQFDYTTHLGRSSQQKYVSEQVVGGFIGSTSNFGYTQGLAKRFTCPTTPQIPASRSATSSGTFFRQGVGQRNKPLLNVSTASGNGHSNSRSSDIGYKDRPRQNSVSMELLNPKGAVKKLAPARNLSTAQHSLSDVIPTAASTPVTCTVRWPDGINANVDTASLRTVYHQNLNINGAHAACGDFSVPFLSASVTSPRPGEILSTSNKLPKKSNFLCHRLSYGNGRHHEVRNPKLCPPASQSSRILSHHSNFGGKFLITAIPTADPSQEHPEAVTTLSDIPTMQHCAKNFSNSSTEISSPREGTRMTELRHESSGHISQGNNNAFSIQHCTESASQALNHFSTKKGLGATENKTGGTRDETLKTINAVSGIDTHALLGKMEANLDAGQRALAVFDYKPEKLDLLDENEAIDNNTIMPSILRVYSLARRDGERETASEDNFPERGVSSDSEKEISGQENRRGRHHDGVTKETPVPARPSHFNLEHNLPKVGCSAAVRKQLKLDEPSGLHRKTDRNDSGAANYKNDFLLKRAVKTAFRNSSTTDTSSGPNSSEAERRVEGGLLASFTNRIGADAALEEPKKSNGKAPLVKFIQDLPVKKKRRKGRRNEGVKSASNKFIKTSRKRKDPSRVGIVRPRHTRSISLFDLESKRPRLVSPEACQSGCQPHRRSTFFPKSGEQLWKKPLANSKKGNSLEDWLKSTRTAPHKMRAPIQAGSPIAGDSESSASDADTYPEPISTPVIASENKVLSSEESNTNNDTNESAPLSRTIGEPPLLLSVFDRLGGEHRRRLSLAEESNNVVPRHKQKRSVSIETCPNEWRSCGRKPKRKRSDETFPGGQETCAGSVKCSSTGEYLRANRDLKSYSKSQELSNYTFLSTEYTLRAAEHRKLPKDGLLLSGKSEDFGFYEKNDTFINKKETSMKDNALMQVPATSNARGRDAGNMQTLSHSYEQGIFPAVGKRKNQDMIANRDPRKAFLKRFPSFLEISKLSQNIDEEAKAGTRDKIPWLSANLYSDISDEEVSEPSKQSFGRNSSFDSYFGQKISMISILSLQQTEKGMKQNSVSVQANKEILDPTSTSEKLVTEKSDRSVEMHQETVAGVSLKVIFEETDRNVAVHEVTHSKLPLKKHQCGRQFQGDDLCGKQKRNQVVQKPTPAVPFTAFVDQLNDVSQSLIEHDLMIAQENKPENRTTNVDKTVPSSLKPSQDFVNRVNKTIRSKETLNNQITHVVKAVSSTPKRSQDYRTIASSGVILAAEKITRAMKVKVESAASSIPKKSYQNTKEVTYEAHVPMHGSGNIVKVVETESRQAEVVEIGGSSASKEVSDVVVLGTVASKNISRPIMRNHETAGSEGNKSRENPVLDATELRTEQSLSLDLHSCNVLSSTPCKSRNLVPEHGKSNLLKLGYSTHSKVSDVMGIRRVKRRRLVKKSHESTAMKNTRRKSKRYRLIQNSSGSSDEEQTFPTKGVQTSQVCRQHETASIQKNLRQSSPFPAEYKVGSVTERNANYSNNSTRVSLAGQRRVGIPLDDEDETTTPSILATVATQFQKGYSGSAFTLGERAEIPILFNNKHIPSSNLFEAISPKKTKDAQLGVDTSGRLPIMHGPASSKTRGEKHVEKTKVKLGVPLENTETMARNVSEEKSKKKQFKSTKVAKSQSLENILHRRLPDLQLNANASKCHLFAQNTEEQKLKQIKRSKVRMGNWPAKELATVKALKPCPLPVTKKFHTSLKMRKHFYFLVMQKLNSLGAIINEMPDERNGTSKKSLLPVSCDALSSKQTQALHPITYRGKIGKRRWYTREAIQFRYCVVKLQKMEFT